MDKPWPPDSELERRVSARLLDVLIRAGLIAVLAGLCYVVFAPFLTLMAWALILAVTLYPLHRWLARKLGGRQGLAATLVVISGMVLIIAPVILLGALGALAAGGILGMFVGATLLALGYQIFMGWAGANPDSNAGAPATAD
jgi:hypothetical protein